MTESQANRYLPQVFKTEEGRLDRPAGLEDGQYGPVQGFFHVRYDGDGTVVEDEPAIRRQAEFGDTAFQWGTNGLCGCTMVTLVSRRAVWMAHFWETYSNGDSDCLPALGLPTVSDGFGPDEYATDHEASYEAFEERVINALSELDPAGPTTPTGRTSKRYILPEGPPIDPDLFNRDDDGTMLLISSPWASKRDMNTLRYRNRVPVIASTIADMLETRPEEHIFSYLPYNYRNRAEYNQAQTDKRGHALFQYDPDADGAGHRGWRLIYEGQEWRGFPPESRTT